MNKRQKKKMKKKRILVIMDEFNFISMTESERENAYKDYLAFEKKYAYRKKYKNLKNAKKLYYYIPMGESAVRAYREVYDVCRKHYD